MTGRCVRPLWKIALTSKRCIRTAKALISADFSRSAPEISPTALKGCISPGRPCKNLQNPSPQPNRTGHHTTKRRSAKAIPHRPRQGKLYRRALLDMAHRLPKFAVYCLSFCLQGYSGLCLPQPADSPCLGADDRHNIAYIPALSCYAFDCLND